MQKTVGRVLFQKSLQYRFGLAEATLAQQQGRQGLLRAFRVPFRRRPQPAGLQRPRLVARKHRDFRCPAGYARIARLPRQIEISRVGNTDRTPLPRHLGHQKLEQDFGGERLPGQRGLRLGGCLSGGVGDRFAHRRGRLLRLRFRHDSRRCLRFRHRRLRRLDAGLAARGRERQRCAEGENFEVGHVRRLGGIAVTILSFRGPPASKVHSNRHPMKPDQLRAAGCCGRPAGAAGPRRRRENAQVQ